MTTRGTTKRAQAARTVLQAYRRLFASEDGKIVLKDLMRNCHYFSSTVGNDPYHTYFNEGARSVLLRITATSRLDEIKMDKLTEEINRDDLEMFS